MRGRRIRRRPSNGVALDLSLSGDAIRGEARDLLLRTDAVRQHDDETGAQAPGGNEKVHAAMVREG